ncbi:MAG: CDP-alcohol phosphatidyltransferase family protein [Gemmatimonadales bacterium]
MHQPTSILILADESSNAVVGGLSVLERLTRNCREAWGEAQLLILWREPNTRGRTRLPAGLSAIQLDQGAASPTPLLADGDLLLLRGTLVVGRGVLHGLLATDAAGSDGWPVRSMPSALVAARPALDWDELAALLPEHAPKAAPGRDIGFVAVVESPTDVRQVNRRLLTSLGKPSDGYVARYVNRAFSTRLTGWLANTSVTPNMVSVVVLAFALSAAWFLARGNALGFVLGCALNQCASMLDGTDGELARLKFLDSRQGAWIDTAIDQLGNHLFILALGLGLSRQPLLSPEVQAAYLWEGVFTTVGMAIAVALVARHTRRTSRVAHFNEFNDNLRRDADKGGRLRRAFAAGVPVFRRDTYALVFVVLAVAGVPALVLHFLTFGMLAHLPAIAWVWWSHELRPAMADANRGAANA